MSDFSPSAYSAAAEGIPVTVGDYADGAAGVRQSLEAMALKMREGRLDPAVYGWARNVLNDAGIDGRNGFPIRRQADALLSALRQQTIYTPDAYGAEVISSAAATLCLRKDLCIRAGDCDDLSVALGSALLSLGIPTQIVKQNYGGENQEHVFVVFQDERGNWIYADPSTNAPLGQSPRGAVSEIWVDPMGAIGNIAAPANSQIVTFGRPPLGAPSAAPPSPTSNWALVTDNNLYAGGRYRLGVELSPVSVGWSPQTLTPAVVGNYFQTRYNLQIESAAPTGFVTGGVQSWVIQGVSTLDTLVTTNSPDGFVYFAAIAVEVPAGGSVTPSGQPIAPATPLPPEPSGPQNVSIGAVLVAFTATALVGGLAWSALSQPSPRRRRR